MLACFLSSAPKSCSIASRNNGYRPGIFVPTSRCRLPASSPAVVQTIYSLFWYNSIAALRPLSLSCLVSFLLPNSRKLHPRNASSAVELEVSATAVGAAQTHKTQSHGQITGQKSRFPWGSLRVEVIRTSRHVGYVFFVEKCNGTEQLVMDVLQV